ncbi:DUF1428 domain-containing protein [Bdellovibrio sp. NC01]|uniref:DUF1428 domain-containing protein n=1 Tax=Bdellovibrio sp. NC01 TaxID=2220073 RepID=UPI0011589A34|nr:DUF1428 domain-containing protein [Bdellovibrio sp. NC01]QDK38646.1 DUF1428 domain-containing protein [Bdellovibrio sp. NC01]
MAYVDGFVIPLPKSKLTQYKAIAKKAGKIWREHGALNYVECISEDPKVMAGIPFPKLAKTKPNEVVVFSWITYKSKADRNRINKKVMNDPRLAKEMGDPKNMPFNPMRMSYGGFKVLVEL